MTTSFKEGFKSKIMDIEEYKQAGEEHGFCPYYFTNFSTAEADIIFLPYNYLLTTNIFKLKEEIKDSIVIFDEAHNIEKVSEEGSSFTLSLLSLS